MPVVREHEVAPPELEIVPSSPLRATESPVRAPSGAAVPGVVGRVDVLETEVI